MAAIPDEKTKVVWTLEVGALEPNSETRGSLQRLFNLGYTTPVQKTTDADTQRAVRAFQIFEKKATTGALADIKADVEAKHDNP
jgi:N-acetyl-anhydromuramyl-L-alanine amidase AmpD